MYAAGAAGPREETCQPRPEVSRLWGGLLSAGRTRNPMRPAPHPRSGSPACHDQVPLRLLRISTKRRMTHRRVADVNRAWCAIRRILLDDQAFFAGARTTCPLPSPRSVRCDPGRMIFSGPSTWRLMGMRPASPPRDDAPDGRHRLSLAWCSDRCRDGRAGHGSRDRIQPTEGRAAQQLDGLQDEEQEAQEGRLVCELVGERLTGTWRGGWFADDGYPEPGFGESVGHCVQRPVPEAH